MATVTSQLTRIHDVEGAVTTVSIVGGPAESVNTEAFIQGAQSVARRQSNVTDHGFYIQRATAIDASGTHIGVWVQHIHYAVLTKFAVRFSSAITNTDFHEHEFPLAAWPKVGGWRRIWVNIDRTPESTLGTLNKAALRMVAVLASLPAVGGTSQNIYLDAHDFTTGGLLLTGTVGVFQDFIGADENNTTNKFGVVVTQSGVIYCLARLTLGSASSLVFNDSDFVVVFPNQTLVSAGFMGVSVDLQVVGTNIDWARGVVKSAGATKGDLVVTGATGTFDVLNTTLASLRVVTLTSACTFDGCLFSACGLITAASAAVKNCTVLNATGSVALLWNTAVDTNAKLDNTKFTSSGTGHAIEFGANTPATVALVGVKFTGYGAGETTDAAIFNNRGAALTINITGGGDTPTIRNGAGSSTTVNNNINVTVTVKDEAGAAIVSARVSVRKVSDNSELVGGLTNASGQVTGTTAANAGAVTVRVRKGSGGVDYVPVDSSQTIGATDFSVTITLAEDTINTL